MSAASDNLRDCQRQLDMDGCEVGVSRQAVDEVLAELAAVEEKLYLANTGDLTLLYDIRRALGWNDKTSLSILADGVARVRRALQTWDTPTGMDLEALALAVKGRVADLERINEDNKTRIAELLEAAEPAVRADRAELADRVRALKQPSTIEPLLMDRIEAWNAAIEAAAVAIAPGS